nr:hypothetical protein [Sunxiuqinia sp.]
MLKTLKIGITGLLLAGYALTACSGDSDMSEPESGYQNYYFNPEKGSTTGDGRLERPFKFLEHISSLRLNPG